jgi:Domain of unknown function (DUF4158)
VAPVSPRRLYVPDAPNARLSSNRQKCRSPRHGCSARYPRRDCNTLRSGRNRPLSSWWIATARSSPGTSAKKRGARHERISGDPIAKRPIICRGVHEPPARDGRLAASRSCFGGIAPDEAHPDTVAHLASQLGLPAPPTWGDEARRTKSLYRYQTAIRAYLSVRPYDETAERLLTDTTLKAAEMMSDPADLINRAVEVLGQRRSTCRPSVPLIG